MFAHPIEPVAVANKEIIKEAKNICLFFYYLCKKFFTMKKLLLFAALAMLIFTGCSKKQSIYDISVKDIDGKEVSMSQYKGNVLLIVNVASKCGLTPQYEGLETLYQKYKDQGLEILAFPCNQFLGQEPGTNDEIQSFCSLTYNVTFPIFDKIDVNGENESPLYTYLKAQAPFAGYPEGTEEFGDMLTQIHKKTGTGFENGDAIKWNFGKFLVSRDGKTIIRFEPMVSPEMMGNDIEKLLKIF